MTEIGVIIKLNLISYKFESPRINNVWLSWNVYLLYIEKTMDYPSVIYMVSSFWAFNKNGNII